MATKFGSIGEAFIDIRANLATLDRDLRRIGKVVSAAGARIQRSGIALTAFLTLPILAVGAAAVKTASDIQEMENLFRETFEGASKDVTDWAKDTARAMQRSRFDLMETAAGFAAFLKPLGVAPKAIAPMSKALTALTVDLSSFRNIAEENVFIALFSGLAGETESVRRLGIDIGAAAVEAELLRLGINKTNAEAAQAEKVLARFNLIMNQTTDAQGDAIRTTDSFENQLRGLMATVKDVAVVIGQKLLPTATRIVQEIRQLGVEFLELSPAVQSGSIAMVAFVATIGPLLIGLGLLIKVIGFAISGLAFIIPVFKFVAKGFSALVAGIRLASASLALIFAGIPTAAIAAFAAVVASVLIFKDTLVGFFKGLINAIQKEFIQGFNNAIVVPFQEAINSIIEFLPDSVIETLGLKPLEVNDIIDNNFKDDMKAVFEQAKKDGIREMGEFKNGVKSIVGKIQTTFEGLGTGFSDLFSLENFNLEDLGKGFDDLLAQFQALVNAQSGVGKAAGKSAGEASEAWRALGEEIGSTIEDNLTRALTNFQEFGNAAKAIINEILTALVRLAVVKPLLAAFGITSFGHGGRIGAGEAGIVGDRGPEVFVPDVSGKIIPNNRISIGDAGDRGGGGDINQEFNFPLVFPNQLEAFVRNVAGPAGRDAATQVMRARRGKF